MQRLLVLLTFILFSAPVFSSPTPPAVSANVVEGPVTGALPDAIKLRVDRLQTISPEDRKPLIVSFCTERTVTEKVYVAGNYIDQPRTYCTIPDRRLNITGKRQTAGVTLTPPMEGEWRWRSDYTLMFKPQKVWSAGQSFTAQFGDGLFPPQVQLTPVSLPFVSAPLSARITELSFFQDPTEVEKRGVSATITFNTPVDEAVVKSHLQFTLEELTDDTTPGQHKVIAKAENMPFEVVMQERGMGASITVPIKELPDKDRFLKLQIKPGMVAKSGGAALTSMQPGITDQRVMVPSRFSYAKVNQAEIRIIKNDAYVPQQIIVIETNVPVTAEQLAKHLSIVQLPKDKPAQGIDLSAKKDYAWSSALEVREEVLKDAPEVKFTVEPGADEYATLHSVKLDTDANRWIYFKIKGGLEAKGGYVLAQDYISTLQVPDYGKEVQILSDGALLSLSGEKKISVYSLGVKKLKFKVSRVMTNDIGHLISQTYGNFENPVFENYNFSEENISEIGQKERALPKADPRAPHYTAFDFTPYLENNPHGKGLFFLSVYALDKDKDGKDITVASAQRFILVSDLGIIVKTARDNSRDVFVQSVESGNPVAGAKVAVIGKNGLPVLEVETNRKGHVTLPDVSGFTGEKQPVGYVVKDGKDMSFMPFNRQDRSLNYSAFDTDGIQASNEGLRAFLFSDRGIYRPGEEIHLGLIVKQGNWAENLEGLPLTLEITNPRGQDIITSTVSLNAVGFAEYSFSTKDVSPTGLYNARLYITKNGKRDGNSLQLGSTPIRVEEFLPDTMKIASEFNKTDVKGWVSPDELKATVTLEHLYGAPAADHRVRGSINVAPGSFYFSEFEGYSFFNAKPAEKSFDQPIGDVQTDKDGKAVFDLNLAQFGDSTYRLTFYGEGFAQDSGRSVKTAKTVLVSPLPYVVGMKPDGNLDYINKLERRGIELIAVDSGLKRVAAENLTAKVMQVSYVSSLIRTEQGTYQYRSMPKEQEVSSSSLSIKADGEQFMLNSEKPGNYVLIISDDQGMVLQRVPYTIVGEGNALGAARKEAVITVRQNKAQYNPGDTMELNIVAPYTGAGLITLETEKVVAFKWFKTDSNSSVQTITVPADFTGKGFVNVQFLRALDSKEVYTKPLAFAVQPFFVSTASIDSAITLTVPEKIKPGETLEIGYQAKRPGKIIVYAVDEGILQYGRYQTPNPIDYFVNKRALQVDTAQILDLLMPEYSVLQQRSAFGGDGALNDGKNLNPFKRKSLPPVAFWSGVVDVDSTMKTVKYEVPDYFNGNLRVMAVSVSDASVGAAEKRVFVKGDLIVSPNVPVFAAPGDEFTVGLSVANNIPGSGKEAKIVLDVAPSEHLEVVGEKQMQLVIPEGEEVKAQVRLKAKDVLGGAAVNFAAHAGDASAKYEATLSVRPPLPSMTALFSGYAPEGQKTVSQNRDLYKEFAKADASVSTLPVSLIPGLAAYLDSFPYGCTEQVVSKAMPAVILHGNPDLSRDEKEIEKHVLATMSRLRELQNQNGGFGYWWSGTAPNDFVSVYALHYMILAREKHLPVPDETLRRAIQYVKTLVNRSPSSLTDARNQAYGIYLLTRSGEVTANYLPNLLQYLDMYHKNAWKNDLAAVYIAAAYKLMQLDAEAAELMQAFTLGDAALWNANANYWSGDNAFYNSLNRYAQYLTIVSEHFPEMLPKLDRNILFRIANFIGEGSYNTLSSAYSILAFERYGAASTQQAGANLSISQAGEALALTGQQIKRAALSIAKSDVTFSGGGEYGLFYQVATDGYDRILPTQPVEDGVEITRQYLNASQEPVTQVAVGDTVDVLVTLRAHGTKTLENMAMVDLLPGGFEVVPDSVPKPVVVNENPETVDGEEVPDEYMDLPEVDADPDAWRVEAVDAREDRVIAYGAVMSGPSTYRYKIKAVNAGMFAVPPAYVESMYDRGIKGRGVTGVMIVK